MNANRAKPEHAAGKLELTLQKAVNSPGLPGSAELHRWLVAALAQSAAITVRFVGLAEGRRLNRAFRDRDYATNVLSFGYGKPGRGKALSGDIVLCAPVVRREARAQGKTLAAHIAHLHLRHLQYAFDHLQRFGVEQIALIGRVQQFDQLLAVFGLAHD